MTILRRLVWLSPALFCVCADELQPPPPPPVVQRSAPCALGAPIALAAADANAEGSATELACVSIANSQASFHWFSGEASNYGWYRRQAQKFLKTVAGALPASATGEAFFITQDDATLPPAVVLELRRLRIPLLAHTIKRPSRVGAVLMPDWHFIQHDGFHRIVHELKAQAKPWQNKTAKIFWRGSTTGKKVCESDGADLAFVNQTSPAHLAMCPMNMQTGGQAYCDGLPRVEVVRRSYTLPWMDAKLVGLAQWCGQDHEERLRVAGLLNRSSFKGEFWLAS